MSCVAVVTGGASGIGLGVARQFVADGHRVAIIDRNASAAEAGAGELRANRGTALAVENVPRRTESPPVSRSDRAGKLSERGPDALMGPRIKAEFVVAAPNVLHQRVAAFLSASRPTVL
jgi:NAD(P)-dependent dehydrogenase (short-subunit alcohol dehydrogenase family)